MVIEVRNLVKRYKEVLALDHFNLEVAQGEILGLLGPNGCGKTTAIHSILSVLKYDKGEIRLFGEPMSPTAYELKQEIGLVPQEVAVFEHLTVRENIDYFCSMYVEDKTRRRELVEEAIAFVGLEEYTKFFPKKLSGGLKRRLNIACGIAHRPKLIFLDEPTVAVDAQSRNFILEGIRRLNREGATILYTTHYLEEAENLCTRIVIMDRGRNIAQGTNEDLKNMIDTREIIRIEIANLSEAARADMESLPHLAEIRTVGEALELSFERGANNLSNLVRWLDDNGLEYQDLYSRKPSLNEVFLALTGKELRD
ncbi:ABC transporter ATP-binding protein [Proteiniclasticum sp. QWL-01]|uniref:ABC transporter ATP-binding protein n=1 Tax=Proteiniclasticum sp. QWL-01 TaxID=3036945 RepID=UPI00220A32E4|nr:ABC transporter ATP-binding protein [Proteiniclasticum sp. QWL-01]UUM11114.1 ABC transporter ATP-binding protein [Clostridiaceae bacterium HFYG-1003]WFF72451.1 ABC transporter ATP-binding protein [Proteiniclasticum sp. QWL-01]